MGQHILRARRHITDQSEYIPLNIALHGTGAIGWTVAGYLAKDRAILTNFGLQLPLFTLGISKVAFGF